MLKFVTFSEISMEEILCPVVPLEKKSDHGRLCCWNKHPVAQCVRACVRVCVRACVFTLLRLLSTLDYCTPKECGYDGDLIIQTDPLLPTYPVGTAVQDLFILTLPSGSVLVNHSQYGVECYYCFSDLNCKDTPQWRELDPLVAAVLYILLTIFDCIMYGHFLLSILT